MSDIFFCGACLANPHIQTLLPRVIRRRPRFVPFMETLELEDGDFLDIAWSEAERDRKKSVKPLFILFHGLEGSFASPYANGLMAAFRNEGWLAVMMHFRGCSGRPNRLARAYHSGEIGDARSFLQYLAKTFPENSKMAVGVSLGGNMLANYLAAYNQDPLVHMAAVISAPFDLAACVRTIEKGFSVIYSKYLLGSLKRNLLKKIDLIKLELGISEQEIKKINSLEEFDDKITAPLHGFEGSDDYYNRCSALSRLNDIRIPFQIIQAADDPFMTKEVIPRYRLNDNLEYLLLEHGGHVGFLGGNVVRPVFWLEDYLVNYYRGLIS